MKNKLLTILLISLFISNKGFSSPTTLGPHINQDTYITGNAIRSGNFNTKGFKLEVTGNLTISGQLNLKNSDSTVVVNKITVSGNVLPKGGTIRSQTSVTISGWLDGSVTINYCTTKLITGRLNTSGQIVQQQCGTDTDGDGVNDSDDAYPNDITRWIAPSPPLDSCPTEAFLAQGSPAVMYGIDLSTGSYRTLAENMSATSSVNAIAFNTHDRYMYGWDKARQSLVRIGSDFQSEALAVSGNVGGHYYVGDISTTENAYYIYRKGSNDFHGLWRIELDTTSPQYLTAQRIVDGQTLFLAIYDFAFHPDENIIYTVDGQGRLHSINPVNGSRSLLGQTGVTGTFGAIYFDVSGYMYISRNKDGAIYRIDVNNGIYTAELFAQGPSSSSNDGARCSFAEVIPLAGTLLDFGDAPDTYGTSMAANGARHEVGGNIFLGDGVDGETQAYISPSSDDQVSDDDEDGVNFISSLAAGAQAIVNVNTSSNGFLNAWIDFDQNGVFSTSEKVIDGISLTSGSHNITLATPAGAKQGDTWSRFRYSSVQNLDPTGGAPDGEVEDHNIAVTGQVATVQYYPSVNGFVTIAFEDLWPSKGDYDMNDFVVNYRTSYSAVAGLVTAVSIRGEITAIGATFHNGFGVEIKGLTRANIDESSINYVINDINQSSSPLEAGHINAVFIVANDVWDYIEPAEGCSFYRTEANCGGSPIQFSFTIEAQLTTAVLPDEIELGLYNPFIFATNGFNRNSIFSSPPGRPLEVHLKNNTPTALADPALLARADDYSNAAAGLYYLNQNGLPWALEIGTEWKHPGEYIDLISAYPDFTVFVQSNGELNKDWYLLENADTTQLYQD
jgi:LruC domain-containing protein